MNWKTSLEQWLGRQARRVIARHQPLVITVSGSVGKSSTKQAIAAVLNEKNDTSVRVSRKNYNNELGVPLTVFGHDAPGRSPLAWIKLMKDAWLYGNGLKKWLVETLVLEMGIDNPGDFKKLLAIAKPNVAVITAITPEGASLIPSHVANFASLDAYASEELEPLRVLEEGDLAIINGDDQRLFGQRSLANAHIGLFGEMDAAEVRLISTKIRVEETPHGKKPLGLEVHLESLNRPLDLFVPGVFGKSVAYAICAALAVGEALDIEPELMRERLEAGLEPMKGRTRIIPGIKYTTLFDDSYNASVPAVVSALKDLATLETHPTQKKIACLGEMREIGEKAKEMHRLVGAEAAKRKIDLLVACGTLAPAMQEGALANGMKQEQIKVFEDTPEAGLFLQEIIKPGDIVLAKASEGRIDSKGVRMERVIKELMAEPNRAAELLVRQEEIWQRK